MTCKICGRGACTESFHSIEEQEEFETKTGRYEPEEEVKLCICCEEITEENAHLHRNCGK